VDFLNDHAHGGPLEPDAEATLPDTPAKAKRIASFSGRA